MERESIGRGVALQHKILALNNLNRKVHFGELKWLKSLISMTTFTKLPLFSAAFLQVAGTWAAYGRHWKWLGPGLSTRAAKLANSTSSGRESRGSMISST